MTQRPLFDLLIAQALELPLPVLTRRDVVWPQMPGKVQAITGMRRAGKTTYLHQIMREFQQGGMEREGLLYLNFEDERLLDLPVNDLTHFVEAYFRRCPDRRGKKKSVFCFDEIQLIQGWETFVRRLLDTENVQIFVSGSSSRMLSREVASSLRGRGLETTVWPFSFREFLRHQGTEPEGKSDFWTPAEVSRMEAAFHIYLRQGGFPEAQNTAPALHRQLLQSYVDACLFRDVVERHHVTNLPALRSLIRQLLASPASLFSIHKCWNDMKSQGMAVAKESLHAWLGQLEDAFLLFTAPLCTASERQRQVNPRKVYPCDHGLIPVYDRTGRANLGHSLETVVAVELKRRGAELAYALTQDGAEVDFAVTEADGSKSLIQVAAELRDEATLTREFRPFQPDTVFMAPGWDKAPRLLLTLDMSTAIQAQSAAPQGTTVRPVWAWLLEGS
jgi:uncharacterized protein